MCPRGWGLHKNTFVFLKSMQAVIAVGETAKSDPYSLYGFWRVGWFKSSTFKRTERN